MNTADIVPGRHYAYRANPRSRDPFQRIEAIEKVATSPGIWKVRFLDDPYPGLFEYVRTATIIAPWSQVKAVERYERNLDRVRAVSDRQWPGSNHPSRSSDNYPPVVNSHEVAEMLGLSDIKLVQRKVREGRIPAYRLPGARRYWFLRDEIIDWLVVLED